jgi:hypothetical protein
MPTPVSMDPTVRIGGSASAIIHSRRRTHMRP